MPYFKLPNIFNTNPIVITQALHGSAQANQSMDFAPSDLITPFNGCKLVRFVESGTGSYFDLQLPDGSVIQCVHGRPTKSLGSTFNKGEVFGKNATGKGFATHWHIAIKVVGQWRPILEFIDRGVSLKQSDAYSFAQWGNTWKWQTWSTYADKTLLLPESVVPQQPAPVPQPQSAPQPNYQEQINHLNNQINEKNGVINDLSNQINDRNNRINELTGNVNGLNNLLTERQAKIVELNNTITDLNYKLNQTDSDLAKANRDLQNENNSLTARTAKLEADKDFYAQQINELNKENNELKAKLQIQEVNTNSSTKPFYLSKKWLADTISTVMAGVVALQPIVNNLNVEWDMDQTVQANISKILLQSLPYVLTALGIKFSSNKYVSKQAEIDKINLQYQKVKVNVTQE